MTRHRNPRPRLPKRPPQDNLDDLLDLLRDHVARADALLTAAEELIERPSPGTDESVDEDADDHPGRRRNYMVSCGCLWHDGNFRGGFPSPYSALSALV